MELKQLRYFARLCSDLNFTAAARNLYITQQALSRSIRGLENELGVKLFIREHGGLRLTRQGADYKKVVTRALGELDEAGLQFRIQSGRQKVMLRVGFCCGTSAYIQGFCSGYLAENPMTEFVKLEMPDRQCEESLLSGNLDITFVTGVPDRKRFRCIHLLDFSIYVAMSASHPLARRACIRPEDLNSQPLYDAGDEFNVHRHIKGYCKAKGVSLQYKAHSLDKLMLLHTIKNEGGMMFLTSNDVENMGSLDGGIVAVPFTQGEFRGQIYAICPKSGLTSGLTENLFQYLFAQAKSVTADDPANHSEMEGACHE